MTQESSTNQIASQVICDQLDALAARIFQREMEVRPKLALQSDAFARAHFLNDVKRHLEFLAKSLERGDPTMFSQYMRWVQELLEQTGCPGDDLTDILAIYAEVLCQDLDPEMAKTVQKYLDLGLNCKSSVPFEMKSFLDTAAPLGELARNYFAALREGNRNAAIDLLLDAVDAGTSVPDVYVQVLQRIQEEVGRLWQLNELSIAKEHFITASTQLAVSILSSYYAENDKKGWSMVAACVSGELHDIGLHIITEFFEMEGWNTYYLGANVPTESIIECLREQHADLVAISATLPVQVPEVAAIIRTIRADKDISVIKILVGGFPFNQNPQLWKEVGADGYAKDATEAVRVANSWVADKN